MMPRPIDSTTGLQDGSVPHLDGKAPLLVGWLVTHSDGTQARLPADKARADHYAATHGGHTVEPMFVFRPVA
jgi:hypothetical protein